MLAPRCPAESLVDSFVLDPLLFLLPCVEAESTFLFFELDTDCTFSVDEVVLFLLEEEALLFTLSVGVARILSSSEPSSFESSSLIFSSSLQLESTKSHLPLLMSPFNALPLLRRFNCSFFGNTAYERSEPKQHNDLTVTLLVLLKTGSKMPSR